MNFKSYVGKVFVVESSKAIIRDEQFNSLKYQAGEVLPPGKQVGDVKTIPRTEIKVTGFKQTPGGTLSSSPLRPMTIGSLVSPALRAQTLYVNVFPGLAPRLYAFVRFADCFGSLVDKRRLDT